MAMCPSGTSSDMQIATPLPDAGCITMYPTEGGTANYRACRRIVMSKFLTIERYIAHTITA